MAAVLLVIGDTAVPTASDTKWQSILTGKGHTVTTRQDTTAEDTTGFALVVIAPSTLGADLATKYRTTTVPVLHCAPGAWDESGFTAANGVTTTGTILYSDDVTNPVASPYAPAATAVTVCTTGTSALGISADAGVGAGSVPLFSSMADRSNQAVFYYPPGAAMVGLTAAARRLALGIREPGMTTLTAAGQNIVERSVEYAMTGAIAPPPATVKVRIGGTFIDKPILARKNSAWL